MINYNTTDSVNELFEDIDIASTISEKEIEEFHNKLSNYKEFEIELDKLIAEFELHQDTPTLHAKVILLIKKLLMKSSPHGRSVSISKLQEPAVNKYVTKLSQLLIYKRLKAQQEHDIEQEYDSLEHMTAQAKADFKKKIKRFMVYEIYKVLNPRRIAGETSLSNFLHNYAVGGAEYALKYRGGTIDDIKSYASKYPRTPISLQHIASQKHKNNSRSRGL